MGNICKIKNLFVALIVVFSSLMLQSQSIGFGSDVATTSVNNHKPKLSVALSSSFTSFAPGFNFFETSVFPKVSFPVSNKFSISTGIGFSTLSTGNIAGSVFSSNLSSYGHVFVSGTYKVNDKVSLRGTAYKTFLLSPTAPLKENSSILGYNFSNQGFIMDAEYRVTDNFRINVSFEYRQQNYPAYNQNGFRQNNQYINGVSPFSGFSN